MKSTTRTIDIDGNPFKVVVKLRTGNSNYETFGCLIKKENKNPECGKMFNNSDSFQTIAAELERMYKNPITYSFNDSSNKRLPA